MIPLGTRVIVGPPTRGPTDGYEGEWFVVEHCAENDHGLAKHPHAPFARVYVHECRIVEFDRDWSDKTEPYGFRIVGGRLVPERA